MRKGNRELIKEINRNLVLNLIKDQGPISRTDLARLSGLSPASVSGITAALMAINMVQETGEGESRGGRRPVLLRLNEKAGYVVGLKLMENAISIALTDLDARVVKHSVFHGDEAGDEQPLSVETILSRIIDAVERTIRESDVEREQVLGIGIGMAGSIDGESGTCRYSPYFKWRNVQIAQPIAEHFALPVYVENDVNTLTIAEQWFGFGQDVEHFVVVTVGRGIGAGITTNGQFYRGAVGSAGEFGHIPLSNDGQLVTLENLASDPAVLLQVQKLIDQGEATVLTEADPLTMEAVIAAADDGDPLARLVLADSGRWLGIGLATLVNILSPQLIIVGGEGVQAGEWRFEPMREALKAYAFDGLADQLDIVIEPSGDETWARGAATLVLGDIFKSPVHKKESEKVFV